MSTNPVPEIKSSGKYYVFLVAFVAAVGGFLFGYDLSIISGAQQFIKEQFGLNSEQFGFAMGSALIGCLSGPFIGAWSCDRLGRKKSLIFAAFLFGIGGLGTALPNDIITFNIFRIIGGIGVGLASVASPMYIAEIAPRRIRGMLVTMNQLAIVIGSLSAIVIAYYLARYLPAETSWRWMFGSMIFPVIIFMVLLSMLPETPRWLAERNRIEEALKIMTRLNGHQEAKAELQGIEVEIAREKEMPAALWNEMFLPGIRIALFIGVVLSVMSQWTGWSMTSFYMPTIFNQAGIKDPAEAIMWTIIPNVANLFYTVIALYLVDRWGRRPLYLVCTLAMVIAQILLGLVFVFGIQGWPVVLILSLSAAPHAIAIGALSWLVISEIFPTRIRARAMSFCTVTLWVACFISTYMTPVLFDLSEKLIKAPSGVFFLCSLFSLIGFLFIYKMLPETKQRTLEEIAQSWTK
jgi:SP family arabinose:H+ symporter-like MFS transporter